MLSSSNKEDEVTDEEPYRVGSTPATKSGKFGFESQYQSQFMGDYFIGRIVDSHSTETGSIPVLPTTFYYIASVIN